MNFTVYVSDANLNALPAGSIIELSASQYEVKGFTSRVLADGLPSGPSIIGAQLCDDDPFILAPRTDVLDLIITWTVPLHDSITVIRSISGLVDIPQFPIVTTTLLNPGTVGDEYLQTLEAKLGLQPYSWTLDAASPLLPAGLSLDGSSGAISGIPLADTGGAAISLIVDMTDAFGQTVEDSVIELRIYAAPPVILVTSLANGFDTVAYTETIFVANGEPPLTWSLNVLSPPLPTGLSLNPGTGEISGTPTEVTMVTLIIDVVDSLLRSTTGNVDLEIEP